MYNEGTSSFRPDHASDLALSDPLVRAQGLGVRVQSHPCGRVSQQLLNNLHILAIGFQDRRKCVAKCMPGDLLGDIELSSHRLNVIPHHCAQPHRLFPALRPGAIRIGRPHIVGWTQEMFTWCLWAKVQITSSRLCSTPMGH